MNTFCGQCGTQIPAQVLFCGNCGTRVEAVATVATVDEPVVETLLPKPEPAPKKPKPPRKKMSSRAKKIVLSSIAGVVAVFITFTTVSAIDYNNHIHADYDTDVRHEIADHVDMVALSDLLGSNCKDIKSNYATKAAYATLKKRVNYMRGVASAESRRAKAKLNANDWYQDWTPQSFYGMYWYTLMGGPLSESIVAEIAKAEKIKDEEAIDFLSYWDADIEAAAVKACGIKSINSQYSALEIDYTDAKDEAQANADSAPWYPERFRLWSGDADMAYDAVDGTCSSSTRCIHYEILANKTCTNGIYVEVDFTNDYGSKVDWSNATESYLGSGESVVLRLSSYQDDADNVKVTRLECNE